LIYGNENQNFEIFGGAFDNFSKRYDKTSTKSLLLGIRACDLILR
jgi:hypothetical protein